jgi:hypothetical protein
MFRNKICGFYFVKRNILMTQMNVTEHAVLEVVNVGIIDKIKLKMQQLHHVFVKFHNLNFECTCVHYKDRLFSK